MLDRRYKRIQIQERQTSDWGTPSWVDIPGNHRGFIQPVSGDEIFREGKGGEQVTHRLYTNVNTPSAYGYRVVANGNNYIMAYTSQPNGISGVEHHKEILLEEFK